MKWGTKLFSILFNRMNLRFLDKIGGIKMVKYTEISDLNNDQIELINKIGIKAFIG